MEATIRTAAEDVALLGRYGMWEEDRELGCAVALLLMHAKRRHKPVVNLHQFAKAIERSDVPTARTFYARLRDEVTRTLPKYPDIAGTVGMVAQMTDEDFKRMDDAMNAGAQR
jgi:hypothetical protein